VGNMVFCSYNLMGSHPIINKTIRGELKKYKNIFFQVILQNI